MYVKCISAFTHIHALGLAGPDDIQLGSIFILFGAFFWHTLATKALPLECTIRVSVWTERAAGHEEEKGNRDKEREGEVRHGKIQPQIISFNSYPIMDQICNHLYHTAVVTPSAVLIIRLEDTIYIIIPIDPWPRTLPHYETMTTHTNTAPVLILYFNNCSNQGHLYFCRAGSGWDRLGKMRPGWGV